MVSFKKPRKAAIAALLSTFLVGLTILIVGGLGSWTPFVEGLFVEVGTALFLLGGLFLIERYVHGGLEARIETVEKMQRILGKLDDAYGTPDGIRVRGWVFDPQTEDPAFVVIEIDGERIGEFRADRERPDVGRSHGVGGSHGFLENIRRGSGEYDVMVTAVSPNRDYSMPLGRHVVRVP